MAIKRKRFKNIVQLLFIGLIIIAAIFVLFLNQILPAIKNVLTRTQAAENSANLVTMYSVYNDSLSPSWQEWSSADVDTREQSPAFEGSRSISLISQNTTARLFFHPRRPFDISSYDTITLAVRATENGQSFGIQLLDTEENPIQQLKPLTEFGPELKKNQWIVYDIPLPVLSDNNSEISGLVIKGISGHIRKKIFIDNVMFAQYNVLPTIPGSQDKPTPTARPTVNPTTKPTNPTATPIVKPNTPTPTKTSGNNSWWKPTAQSPIHWHWQLSENFQYPRDVIPNVTVYDIDGEYATKEMVSQLHALGPDIKVICYIDAGVYEDYRSDASNFPSSVIGKKDEGWDGSFWLDIRQHDILLPIMRTRIQNWCKNKGFDAVEPDETENQDENEGKNITGFNLKRSDNIAYNKEIAKIAHELGLSIGLKGNTTEAADLVSSFDWTLNEECNQWKECGELLPFINANKAVFNIEYSVNPSCTQMNQWRMNSARRDLNLVGPKSNGYRYSPCIPDTQDNW